MPRSRRALLETAGIALGGGSLASIAGCVSRQSTNSGGTREGSRDGTRGEPSPTEQSGRTVAVDFRQWLPDPTTTVLRDGVGVRYFDVADIRAHRDAIHENAYERLESEMLRPVTEYVDADDVKVSLQVDHTMRMAFGSFDPEAVGERLTSDGRTPATASTRTPTTPTRTPWSEPERYRGFDLYGTDTVYAVSEDAVMHVHPFRDDAVEHAKAFIDAPAAETSQYVDGNEYVASMLGLVDDHHALWCYPEAMDGSTSRGFRKDVITGALKSWRFGVETTHLTFATTYPDTETAESGELATFIESKSDRFGSYEGLDVAVEGRMAWTDGTIPTNEFDHLSAGGPGDGVFTPN